MNTYQRRQFSHKSSEHNMRKDYQRKKTYNAEEKLAEYSSEKYMTIAQAQKFVDSIVSDPFYHYLLAKNFPNGHTRDGKITVRAQNDYATGFTAHAWQLRGEIALTRQCSNELIIIHEIAHLLTPLAFPGHGGLFNRNYQQLVGRFMGKDIKLRLRRIQDAMRVRWRHPWPVTVQKAHEKTHTHASGPKSKFKRYIARKV